MPEIPLTADQWAAWHAWMEAHRSVVGEIDAVLQDEVGVSKAEFSILRTLHDSDQAETRVTDLAEALAWEKSRVSHLLRRMADRGLVESIEGGAAGRRTGVRLSPSGRDAAVAALATHERCVRRLFVDRSTPAQLEALAVWAGALARS